MMCCRYYMEESPELKPFVDAANRSVLTKRMVAKLGRPLKTAGEIRPTDLCVAVAPDRSGKRAVFPMVWGFTGHQSWLFNTRVETADVKPLWKESFERRRCIIPASWYFEWQHLKAADGKEKTGDKYAIQPKDRLITFMAGIYRMEEEFPHFSILTREPGEGIRFIHDRMPVILDAAGAAAWIRPQADPAVVREVLSGALTDMMFEKAK